MGETRELAVELAALLGLTTMAAIEIIESPPVRDRMIRCEFIKRRRSGEKSILIIYDIMEKYDISYSHARHLCYGHNLSTDIPQ